MLKKTTPQQAAGYSLIFPSKASAGAVSSPGKSNIFSVTKIHSTSMD